MSNEMKLKYFGYNTFLIETHDKKIAIDPGALFLYYFRLTTLIPKEDWPSITHILVTHGDPDHYWHADRVAEASGATFVCNKSMTKQVGGKTLLLGPRAKGVAFTTEFKNVHTLEPNQSIEANGISITGIKAEHGELLLKLGPFKKVVKPGPHERIGWGAIGYQIEIDGIKIVNLGDTLLLKDDWKNIESPDILMIPIGGRVAHNTMDEAEALEAVKLMKPKHVIPCHYNCKAFFTEKYNLADDNLFKKGVEDLGFKCSILKPLESLYF